MKYGEPHTLDQMTKVAQSSQERTSQGYYSPNKPNQKYNCLYFTIAFSPFLHSKHNLSTSKDSLEGIKGKDEGHALLKEVKV